MEVIQEIKEAVWKEENTFYGSCVNFDTHSAHRAHIYLLLYKNLFFFFSFSDRALVRGLVARNLSIFSPSARFKDAASRHVINKGRQYRSVRIFQTIAQLSLR